MAEDRKLGWREACKFLRCGKTLFYELVRNGTLTAYKLQGGRKGLWVYEKDCAALLEKIAPSKRS